jgi:hypothetical protein
MRRELRCALAAPCCHTPTPPVHVKGPYGTHPREGAPCKSVLGAPRKRMLGLIADSWILRSKII